MRGRGGRKRDDCWKQVIRLGNGKLRCIHCGHEFVGGATRIKSHLSGNNNQGVEVCTKNLRATNNSIKCEDTRNVEDTTNLCSDIFAEHLTDVGRKKKNTLLNWCLPLKFSNSALRGDISSYIDFVKSQKIREKYMSNLEHCDEIFIPVHNKNPCGHFYLYVIDLKNAEVQIWDSLPSCTPDNEREDITKKLLVALDKLFEDEIRDRGRAFTNFHVTMAKDAPRQSNGYDCGIYVIRFMQQLADVRRDLSFQFHSDQERLDLALQLLKSDINRERLLLIGNGAESEQLHQQNEIEAGHLSGTKRKNSNISTRAFEDGQGAASPQFNYSSSNKRLQDIESLSHADKNLDDLNSPKEHTKGLPLPTNPDLMVQMFEWDMEQALIWLKKDKVSVIGVWGMGGVGKTTLATHIHNRLLEGDYDFDHVIWVTVSQEYNISEMQKIIAKSIDANISGEIGEKRVAARLFHAFKRKKKCVLILDDVWNHIFLEQVGVPITNNGIKLILTTRSLDVCQSMNCKGNIIKLRPPINNAMCWGLFRKNLIGNHGMLPSEIEEIAQNVCRKCGGLPLAIVRVATSMKGKEKIREWRHLLENLKGFASGQIDMKKWVFPVFRSSYDHLIEKKLQQCFLYCALCPSEILDKADLIRNFVCEGLINGTKSLVAQIDEGYSILNKLMNCTLLEECDISFKIMVNRIVIGMAISIAKENYWHMLIRHDQEWSEDVHKVFLLLDENIQEIPFGISPRCPKLSTLLMADKYTLRLIADDFFINMLALQVLDLSRTTIERLPTSVSNLECLVALLLLGCKSLSYVPPLAKLRRLMWLDLSLSAVTQLPLGLELATNFRSLDLRGTDQLKVSSSAIARLSNLQSLYLPFNPELVDVTAEDLQDLRKLEVVSAHFCDIDEYNTYVRSLRDRVPSLTSYMLTLGAKPALEFCSRFPFNDNGEVKLVKFVSLELQFSTPLLPEDVNRVEICGCHQRRCLCHLLSGEENYAHHLLKISICQIVCCHELEYLFCCLHFCFFCTSLLHVYSLILEDVDCLGILCEDNIVGTPVPSWNPCIPLNHLTVLEIYKCNRIKRVLSVPEYSPELQYLTRNVVKDCELVEEIFSIRRSDQGMSALIDSISLPKLEYVNLVGLPKLSIVFNGTMMASDSLKDFFICQCPNLREDPQIHPPIEIKKNRS